MELPVWKILLLLGIGLFISGLAIQVMDWRGGKSMTNTKQRVFRVVTTVLGIVVFAMIFFGDHVTNAQPVLFMLYWIGTFVIACAIVVLTLLDLREMGGRYRDEHRQVIGEISKKPKQDQ